MHRALSGHPLLLVAATGAFILMAGTAGAQTGLAGYDRAAGIDVPLTGQQVALPLPRGVKAEDLCIVLSGVFRCSYNGRAYDPFLAAPDGTTFDQPHRYVRFTPSNLERIEYAAGPNAYVLAFPEGMQAPPDTVSAWVDVDQFVTDLIIRPSEVRDSLSGSLRLEVWRAPRSGPSAASIITSVAVLALVIGLVAWLQRRPRQDMSDVAEQISRIDRKYESAAEAVGADARTGAELVQLGRLCDGARELAAHIASFRNAAATVDRERLREEIARTEQQLEQTDRDDLRQELESTLDAKRKLHDLVADTDANEARYLLRLSKIESAMDATTLRATGQERELADERVDDQAAADLEQELESLDAAIEELKVLD